MDIDDIKDLLLKSQENKYNSDDEYLPSDDKEDRLSSENSDSFDNSSFLDSEDTTYDSDDESYQSPYEGSDENLIKKYFIPLPEEEEDMEDEEE